MAQTVLPFKLEMTEEKLTAHAGLLVFGEFVQGTGILGEVDRELPGPGSGAGYRPSQYLEPLLLMLQGGGRSLEDLRVIRGDEALREVLGLKEMPSSDATGDWLRRQGVRGGLRGLAACNRVVVRRMLALEARTEYTLDIDATQIVAEKEAAKKTYKGERGYMPMVGHLAENGVALGEEFRAGNESPAARNLEFIQHCFKQTPRGKRIAFLRSDSAAYQADVINWCEEAGREPVRFAMGADLDEAVVAAIRGIPAEAWEAYEDGHMAETVHTMNKTRKTFRLVVVCRPAQIDLLTGEEKMRERYLVIASNREESARETAAWYNQRGECSENRIKELKIGFGMERMPCGDFKANAVFFRIGVLAYNLFVWFKTATLPAAWRRLQVQTVRWRLYQAAGKVVHHGRRLILRVSARIYEWLAEIRSRSWQATCTR